MAIGSGWFIRRTHMERLSLAVVVLAVLTANTDPSASHAHGGDQGSGPGGGPDDSEWRD